MSGDLLAAFLVGLLGAGHCLGMCGGIVASISLTLPKTNSHIQRIAFLSIYNFGRILSYCAAGAIVGGIGASLVTLTHHWILILRMISGIFLIGLGIYLIGKQTFILSIERLGKHLWQYISPVAKFVLPAKSFHQVFFLGMLWGWLPCGLVYSTLAWSISSGSAYKGALTMAMFGLGTFTPLLLMGTVAERLTTVLKHRVFRYTSGVVVVCFGVYTLAHELYVRIPL
ncbi:sulfite exporter TauE/SafE family protein [Algicola sagamiensis]|uniref:sulfite exporter TauE/SafE family protein n=1 Tax=Algicola sagamiensis TaxID=163869 RepID=UPI00038178DC|nr:sulfite exporter TauE/SafE family protein [Algicola sagamiensis]